MRLLLVFFVLLLLVPNSFGLNQSDIDLIAVACGNLIIPEINNISVGASSAEVLDVKNAILNNLSATDFSPSVLVNFEKDVNISLTDKTLNDLSKELSDSLRDDVEDVIREETFFLNRINNQSTQVLNPSLQLAIDGAISNRFDSEFQDVQLWFTNTVLPKEAELGELRQSKDLANNDLIICNNNLNSVRLNSNTSLASAGLRVEHSRENENTAYMLSVLLAVLLIVTNFEWVKSLVRKEI